jgi:hypothetical protein
VSQPGELTKLDHLGGDRIFGRKTVQSVVEGEEIVVRVGAGRVGKVDTA